MWSKFYIINPDDQIEFDYEDNAFGLNVKYF